MTIGINENISSRGRRKGALTRAVILEAALDIASRNGLEGLTIGLLAERVSMSKSGVFVHFGSREDLQIAVVQLYHRRFADEIFLPSLAQPRGLPRLEAMFARWVSRVSAEIASGCIYISGAVEYDDRAGAVRAVLVELAAMWKTSLLRCVLQAIDTGHLAPGTDPDQIVFEMYGLILALHHDARFLKTRGSVAHAQTAFRRLIDSARPKSTSTA